MSGKYDVLVQYGDDLFPLQVNQNGTFSDLKHAFSDLLDIPPSQQVWAGRLEEFVQSGILTDDFPLSALGLENSEPLLVMRKDSSFPISNDFDIPAEVLQESLAYDQSLNSNQSSYGYGTQDNSQNDIRSENRSKIPIHDKRQITIEEVDMDTDIPEVVESNRKPSNFVDIESLSSDDDAPKSSQPTDIPPQPIDLIEGDDDWTEDPEEADFEWIEEASNLGGAYRSGSNAPSQSSRTLRSSARGGMGSSQRGNGPPVDPVFDTFDPSRMFTQIQNQLRDHLSDDFGGFLNPSLNPTGAYYAGPGITVDDVTSIGGLSSDGTQFSKLELVGRDKTSFLKLLDSTSVSSSKWNEKFTNRAMKDPSPLHYSGNMNEAIQDAKDNLMFVAVHLFDQTSDTADFYNMIINHDETLSLYSDNYLAFFCCLNKLETRSLSRLLAPLEPSTPTLQLPAVMIIATLKGKLTIFDIAMSSLSRSEYLEKLLTLRLTWQSVITDELVMDQERRAQTALVDEQNDAFEEAQRADAEKQRLEKQKEEIEKQKIFEQQREEEESLQAAQDRQTYERVLRRNAREEAIEAMKNLPQEPTDLPAGKKAAMIGVRLTDGSQVRRKFDPDNTTLKQIFTFAAGSVASKLTDDTFVSAEDPSLPWSIDSYDLTAQFPTRRFTHEQDLKTLKELGISGQEILALVPK